MPNLAPPTQPAAIECRSGLPPWTGAELPEPPQPRGLGWLKAVGPGVIVLGVSIGGGEFLLGPAAFVRYGLSLLWVVGAAVFFQTVFNTELMRYTLATGEPVFTGFMRTRPSSTFWAWFYAVLYFLQLGWPASAGTAAGAIFFLTMQRLPQPADANTIYAIGIGVFLTCVGILAVGRRIERTLELLNWILITAILGGFFLLAVWFVPGATWASGALGFLGFDTRASAFSFVPAGTDLFLLAALVAYSGAGGVNNVVLANWARDRGYGMSAHSGYISGAIGGEKVTLAHSGFVFQPSDEAARRWRGWWRIISADQWGVFAVGAMFGMLLPALLYVTLLPSGTNIQGLGISAELASAMVARSGPLLGGVVAFLGAWALFKTQLDLMEGMVRAITDMLWTGSARLRTWRGGDVRAIYYTVLGVMVVWGIFALRLAQPFVLLQIGANIAGLVLTVASVHLLYLNTRLLPPHVRPPTWRRVALIGMAIFYGVFVSASVRAVLR